MSVTTIAAKLASIQGNITGITKAFDLDEIPNTLHTAHLPAFVNVPGDAVHEAVSADMWRETRTWYMLLFLTPVQRPFEVAQRMAVAAPFFARVRSAFVARPTLESLRYLEMATFRGDSGTTIPLVFGGTTYAGIEFRLETSELVDVSPTDYT